jgi:hypothetical protein
MASGSTVGCAGDAIVSARRRFPCGRRVAGRTFRGRRDVGRGWRDRPIVTRFGVTARARSRTRVVHGRQRPGGAYRMTTAAAIAGHGGDRVGLGTAGRPPGLGRRGVYRTVTTGLGAICCSRNAKRRVIKGRWLPHRSRMAGRALCSGRDMGGRRCWRPAIACLVMA